MDDIGTALVSEVRQRLVTAMPAQVRTAVEGLTDEQVWWRPNDASNSIGNLVLHVCGSTRHFLGRGVGGSDYVRDRPAEFAARGPIPRAELLRLLDDTVAEVAGVLETLDPRRLMETSDRAGEPFTVLTLLLRVSHHWAVHSGQILYAAKAIRVTA
jgi:hypothetical protein